MASITTRETAASPGDRAGITNNNAPLTNAIIDANFIQLNNDKMEESDAVSTNTANKVVKRDSNGNFAMNDLTAGDITAASLTISGGSGLPVSSGGTGATTASGARTNLGLAIGSDVQGYDADLNAVAGLTTTGFAYRTGTNTWVASNSFTTADLRLQSIGIGTAASGTAGEIRASGQITSHYSDMRLKENIELIENPLEKVDQLRGVSYNANQIAEGFGFNKEKQVGVIAQEVQEVLPEAIRYAPFDRRILEGKEYSKSGEDYLTVQYEMIIPLLVEAIKELNKQVKELQGIK